MKAVHSLLALTAASLVTLLTPHAEAKLGKVHAIEFRQMTKVPQDAPVRLPNIWINTNITADDKLNVNSKGPYHIQFDFTDETFTYKSLSITKVSVTYDDGKAEDKIDKLKLPHVIKARPYKTVNSMGNGKVVKGKVNQISGKLEGVITRDESFTLKLEGFYTLKDGVKKHFTINYDFAVHARLEG